PEAPLEAPGKAEPGPADPSTVVPAGVGAGPVPGVGRNPRSSVADPLAASETGSAGGGSARRGSAPAPPRPEARPSRRAAAATAVGRSAGALASIPLRTSQSSSGTPGIRPGR